MQDTLYYSENHGLLHAYLTLAADGTVSSSLLGIVIYHALIRNSFQYQFLLLATSHSSGLSTQSMMRRRPMTRHHRHFVNRLC